MTTPPPSPSVVRALGEPQRKSSSARTIGIASAIWGVSIFLSRIMGLVREQIIGRTLGASREADLYFASFTLPDFLNYLLAAGALSIVFIPMFLEYFERGDRDGGWQAFSAIANFILVAGGVAIALLMVFARPLAGVVAPGFTEPSEVDTLVRLMRIILPAQFFHVIGGLLSATLQAQDLHLLPAMAPLVYSAGIIIGGLAGAQLRNRSRRICVGCARGLRARAVRAAALWLPAHAHALVPRFCRLANADLRRYLWLSFPIMVGFSIVVVDEWIVKNQASYLAAGALSELQYGRTLMKVPIGVFGMAAGVAAYPTISRMVAAGNVAEAYGVLCGAVRLMLFATFAAQVCLTLAGFEAAYLIWGSVREPVQRCRRAGHRHHPRLSVPRSRRLGGADGDQPRLLRSRQHLAADHRRHHRRIRSGAALRRAAPALGHDRARDRKLDLHHGLRAGARLAATPPLRTGGRRKGNHAPRRAGHAGRRTAPRPGGGHRHRHRTRRARPPS